MPRANKGFTLIELVVVIGVIGVLVGIAIPLYGKYADTASMSIANYHYQEAIKSAKATQVQQTTSIAIGSGVTTPTTAAEWIAVFGPNDKAPGGGPAYVASALGDAGTGAVGVTLIDATSVSIVLPAYLDLPSYQAIVVDGRATEAAL